jgi:hypothetical protein
VRRTRVTQELTNCAPSWSRISTDDQSVGFQLFNALGTSLSDVDKQLFKMGKNQYLSTANLDEPDLSYLVKLPKDFIFTSVGSDFSNLQYTPPTVIGTLEDDSTVSVTEPDSNDIQGFWYNALPNRVTIDDTLDVIDFSLLSQAANLFPSVTTLTHHLASISGGGKLWIDVSGGNQYLTKDSVTNTLNRATIVLTGITRKGTSEVETLIFAWDEKRQTQKEWRYITEIQVFNFEPTVTISVSSGDFNKEPYLSFFNLRYSPNRRKIDEFWQLNEITNGIYSPGTSLALVGFITDEWEQLIGGLSGKEVKEEWELLDENNLPIIAADMTIQPFTDRTWVIANNKKLYCYDLEESTIENIELIKDRTFGPDVKIEMPIRRVLVGEEIVFSIIHQRPVQEIASYRVWYQDPNGNKYGLLNGNPVSFSSDFSVSFPALQRLVQNETYITTSIRGDYLLVLEVTFLDGTTQTDKVIFSTNQKNALSSLDLSSLISEDVIGLDFDSDQKLWVLANGAYGNKYYQINFHYDIMLIDYTNKVIYFREKYTNVDIT